MRLKWNKTHVINSNESLATPRFTLFPGTDSEKYGTYLILAVRSHFEKISGCCTPEIA